MVLIVLTHRDEVLHHNDDLQIKFLLNNYKVTL